MSRFKKKGGKDTPGISTASLPDIIFMLLFFFNSYASGLSYYYLTANVVTMLQQFVVKKFFIDEDKIHRQIQENKKKPSKKSGFQQRLEKMAKDRGYKAPKK